MHAGDLLTLGRLMATPLFVWSFRQALQDARWSWLAGLIFALVCVSDVYDGRLARRAGRASARGRVMDSAADIVFLLGALGSAWALGLAPWWVPAAVAASFGYYVVDSWVLTRATPGPTLVASRLGHWGGVCNYVLVGVLTFNNAGHLGVFGARGLLLLYCLVPLYSGAAIAARMWK